PLTRAAADSDIAIQHAGEVERDGEPQPGAAGGAGHRFGCLPEGLEHLLLVLFGDTAPRVADFEVRIVIAGIQAELDAAAVGEAHRVAEQVQEYASDLCRVGRGAHGSGGESHIEVEALGFRSGAYDALGIAGDSGEVDGATVDDERTALHAGEGEDFVDELEE